MNIVERASVVNKWFARDPNDHRYVFLMLVMGLAVLILPLTGLFVITNNQSTQISAQLPSVDESGSGASYPCGTECVNMDVSWTRPAGYAQFVDAKGKTVSCTSADLSCTASGVFTPNSVVNYSVKVKDAKGAVIKMGTDTVTPKKTASASWSWTYAVAVFPSTYADCIQAGTKNECSTKVVTNDNSQNSVVFSNLRAGTEYMVYVCAPNCGEGTAFVVKKQVTPSLPAACVFAPTTLVAGSQLGIITNRFKTGDRPVKIAGRTFGNVVSVGSIPYTGGSVTIPTTVPAPQQYDVLVNNGTDVTCTGILQVNPASIVAAKCGLGSTSVVAGQNLGFGYDGFTAGQKIFIWDGGVNRVDLGTTLSGSQLVSFTIPSSTPAGRYGGFIENVPNDSVVCGSVTVSVPTISCTYDYNKDGKVDSADVDILNSHFGESVATSPNSKIYDLDGNGEIDLNDALLLTAKFGTC